MNKLWKSSQSEARKSAVRKGRENLICNFVVCGRNSPLRDLKHFVEYESKIASFSPLQANLQANKGQKRVTVSLIDFYC
jgi:hypothetical protein